ncbi:MAG: hypothetical protein WA902_00455 [Thermosynechococcaceae cyanobacterium]
MRNNELIQKFIKIEKGESETVILVCSLEWKSPYEPVSNWKKVKILEINSLKSEVDMQINEILNDERYFRFCIDCGECNLAGHTIMLQEKSICHSCAERNHGVVF